MCPGVATLVVKIFVEGREPLLRGPAGPEGRKRLSWRPRVSKAGCHPFIKATSLQSTSPNVVEFLATRLVEWMSDLCCFILSK